MEGYKPIFAEKAIDSIYASLGEYARTTGHTQMMGDTVKETAFLAASFLAAISVTLTDEQKLQVGDRFIEHFKNNYPEAIRFLKSGK